MNWLPSPETRAAVLKNPFVLAGLAVVVLLGATAGVLVLVDSARNSTAPAPAVVVDQTTATPGPVARTAVAAGVQGTAKQVTAVRSAPGRGTPVLGTMPQGSEVVIDGRTTDSGWYRVIYPPGSELHGWVEADFLTVTGDAAALVVATAEPPVYVDVPTLPPADTPVPSTPSVTATAAGTPTATALPDLVIGTTPTISGGLLFVTVINQGRGPAVGNLVVAVFNQDGSKLLGGATVPNFTLEPGRSIDVGTGLAVSGDQTLLIIVDPNGTIPESDDTNNRILIRVATGQPSPTAAVPAGSTPAHTPTPQ
ncbi:MAG: SH3 domain-containing protein [Chloroflexota bacterium]|nr:SH3 domain-containing protein [Chloroflexota bacterium]